MKRWSELEPDNGLLRALIAADEAGTRSEALASADQGKKRNWSNRFADVCARMVADEILRHKTFSGLDVRPNEDTKAEPITFLVGGKRKKVDVIVSGPVGLQIGISLKGMNFRDRSGLQFDKNLTGRTYELEDEVRALHRTLPMAFLVALYFLPIASTVDKTEGAASSFGRTVEHLRARVGRTDPQSPTQIERLDMAAVALYVPGDDEKIRTEGNVFAYRDSLPRGVVRYLDVTRDPPRRGRPMIDLTDDLAGFVSRIEHAYREFIQGEEISWSEAEPD